MATVCPPDGFLAKHNPSVRAGMLTPDDRHARVETWRLRASCGEMTEAGLSYLGVGEPPGVPSWGNILSDGRAYMIQAPWITLFPGLAIVICVLGLNLFGDGLRDVLDPRLRGE